MRLRTAILAAYFLSSAACSGEQTRPVDEPDSASLDATTGDVTADTTPTADGATDGPTDGATDEQPAAAVPEPIDAQHEVHFIVENHGVSPKLVVVDGLNCTPVTIERKTSGGWDWENVPLALVAGLNGNCSGNDYEDPRAHHLAWVAPGATATIPWDGRGVVTYEGEANCFGDPGLYGVSQPLEGGTYRVSVGVWTAPPDSTCVDDGAVVDCSYGGFTSKLPVPLESCPSPAVAMAQFVLPDSGALDVSVVLSAPESDDCPIVNGACPTGCSPAMGTRLDEANACYIPPAKLLLCHDIHDTYPAQSLPLAAPDGSCWMVDHVVKKFEDLGWTSAFEATNGCDGSFMQGAPVCP